MDKLIEKIEAIIEKQLALFDEKPIATSIKFLVVLWILKYVYREIKKA